MYAPVRLLVVLVGVYFFLRFEGLVMLFKALPYYLGSTAGPLVCGILMFFGLGFLSWFIGYGGKNTESPSSTNSSSSSSTNPTQGYGDKAAQDDGGDGE